MDLFVELNELMVKYRFRPNKKMGQNFIIEFPVLEKMIEEADLSEKDVVLEIGAGAGFLTRELQKKCTVKAIELDDTLFNLLESELPKKNIELFHGDFLDLDVGEFNKVVSLPPYTISSAIIGSLFKSKPKLCVLVLQREFAEKLEAEAGFMEYNAISVLTQYRFRVKIVSRVMSSSFFPRPNTDSAIVKLTRWEENGVAVNEAVFRDFIKSVFRFQNKSLLNAVKNSLQFLNESFPEKERVLKLLDGHELANEKVTQLSCKELVKVFNRLMEKK